MDRALIAAAVLCCGSVALAGAAPLPEPLTLDAALTFATADHPELERARARLDEADAELALARAQRGINVGIGAALRFIEPSDLAADQSSHDSLAYLRVSKRLYDFGLTAASEEAAEAERRGRELLVLDRLQQRRIDIRRRYFDVLLADLQFARDDEAMAVAYVRLDKARDRHELGQLSDIALFEIESDYQAALTRRTASDLGQRTARAALATALNRPGELSSRLVPPALDGLERTVDEPDAWIAVALRDNVRIAALRARLDAAGQRIRRAERLDGPRLNGELEAAAHARTLGGRDPLTAALVFELPLSTGGRTTAERARARAAEREVTAELAAYELELRQALYELWREIRTLLQRRKEIGVLGDYRELYLDRSRALYELEMTTDLGDSMTNISDARLKAAQADFELDLAWARLDALLGRGGSVPGVER